jgi:hypothetical protein
MDGPVTGAAATFRKTVVQSTMSIGISMRIFGSDMLLRIKSSKNDVTPLEGHMRGAMSPIILGMRCKINGTVHVMLGLK